MRSRPSASPRSSSKALPEPDDIVLLGRIAGVFGVRGWVKVFSHTEPRENILGYQPWLMRVDGRWQEASVLDGRLHGKIVVARLEGIDDRDGAAALMDTEIGIARSQLPGLAPGEWYHADLVGCAVVTINGIELGQVSHLFATGANQVMVVKGDRERLVPFLQGSVIREVDTAGGRIVVDWDPEF